MKKLTLLLLLSLAGCTAEPEPSPMLVRYHVIGTGLFDVHYTDEFGDPVKEMAGFEWIHVMNTRKPLYIYVKAHDPGEAVWLDVFINGRLEGSWPTGGRSRTDEIEVYIN